MTAYVSTQTGNWTDTATWGGGGYPQSGDSFTITNGHTVTQNANVTVGDGSTVSSIEGRLTLGAYTFTLAGPIKVGNGTNKAGQLDFAAGGTLAISTYTLYLNNCKLTSAASSGSWATVTAGSGGKIDVGSTSSSPKEDIVLTYVKFDFAGGCINFPVGSGSSVPAGWTVQSNVQHCTFIGSGYIYFSTSGLEADKDSIVKYNDFRNVGNINIKGVAPTTGTHQFMYNTVSNATKTGFNVGRPNCTVQHNVYYNMDANVTLAGTGGGHTYADNFFALPSGATSGSAVISVGDTVAAQTTERNYFYTPFQNPHTFGISSSSSSGGSGTHDTSYNVFEAPYQAGDPGNNIAATILPNNVHHNLFIGYGSLWNNVGSKTSALQDVYNNTTYITANTPDYGALMLVETGVNAGTIRLRDNLTSGSVTITAGVNNLVSSNQTLDVCGYNGWHNVTSDYKGTNFGDGGATAYFVITDDQRTNDVTGGDPLFVDATRNLAAWDDDPAHGSGTGTADTAIAYLLNINGYNSGTKTQSGTPSTNGVTDLVTWVQAGFKIQNGLYNGASSTAGVIGAFDWQESPITVTVPAGSLSISGYFPTVTGDAPGPVSVTVPTATLTITGRAPTIKLTDPAAPHTVTWKFYIDWNNDDDFEDANEDITAYVISASYSRGRDYASNLTGKSSAGTCSLKLLNLDGKFSPFNTASALYGKLVPKRKIQITTYDSSTASYDPQWTGYIETITPLADISGLHTAEITGIGPLAIIAERYATVALKTDTDTGSLIDDVLDAAGWPSGDRDIDSGKTIVPYFWCEGRDALNVIRELEESENGFIYETKDGKIAFENRHHRYGGTHLEVQKIFTDEAAPSIESLGYNAISHEDSLSELYNVVTATTTQRTAGTLTDLWTLPESGSLSPAIDPGDSLTYWGTPLADVAELVLSWTDPVATTDYTANSLPTGNGTDLTSDITVTATKFAKSIKLVVSNGGASTAYLTLLKARGIPLVAGDAVTVEASGATSITNYGERSYPIEAPWLSNSTLALKYCEAKIDEFKDPRPVASMGYPGYKNVEYASEVVARDIGDRISVDADGAANLGFDSEFYVESISVQLSGSYDWDVTYSLSPCPTVASNIWVLGSSNLGSATTLVDIW